LTSRNKGGNKKKKLNCMLLERGGKTKRGPWGNPEKTLGKTGRTKRGKCRIITGFGEL